MKKLLWLLPMLLIAAAPPPTWAKAGQLDKTFGRGGKVKKLLGARVLPGPDPHVRLAWEGRGTIVVAAGNTLFGYTSQGLLRGDFGRTGSVSVRSPLGRPVDLTGLTIDSRGRILVTGTTELSNGSSGVLVGRYLPGGRPDRGFGNGGSVVTDFGLSAPTPPENRALAPVATTGQPEVTAAGLAVDAADRPVISGAWVTSYQDCYPFITETPRETGYVARLTVQGSVDSSFGTSGVAVPDAAREIITAPVVNGDGLVSVSSLANCLRGSPTDPELARLAASGKVDTSFGTNGRSALQFWTPPILAHDPFHRILLLGQMSEGDDWVLQRRSSNGELDSHFGQDGNVRPPLQPYCCGALALDARGRPLLAGDDGPLLLVERLKRNGTVNRSFGHRGEATTVFPADIAAQQILVGDSGKILVGGILRNRNVYGIAVARFLGR